MVLEVMVRPVAMLAMLATAYGLSRLLWPLIPAGRVKQLLYKKRELIPSDPSTVKPWEKWAAGIIVAIIAILVIFKPFRPL